MSKSVILSQEIVCDRFSASLHEAAAVRPSGRSLSQFVGELAEATQITERTLQSYLAGVSAPVDWRYYAVANYLSSPFINRNHALIRHGHIIPLDAVAEAPDGNKAMAAMATEMNELATALIDMRLSRSETRDLAPRFRKLAKTLNDFADSCEAHAEGRNS